jgi:hypothetical protein
MNLLGLHVPASPNSPTSPTQAPHASHAPPPYGRQASAPAMMPKAKAEAGLESDKDLIDFLMDDENFK